MQGLEKILEEIRKAFEENTEYIADEDGYHHFVIDSCTATYLVNQIIRKHMNDGWIPVEERMPERTLDEKINKFYKKYLVFIDSVDGWDIDIAVYDFWNDKNGVKLMMDMERLKKLSPGVLFQSRTKQKGANMTDKERILMAVITRNGGIE